MKFISPEFLFALFALAIPVLIHLFNFRKYKKVYFTNVQLLQNMQQQTSSVKNLKNRLILASRVLAFTFLVFAFAKPYFPAKQPQIVLKEQVISMYVDNSFSMEAINKEGSLFDEAKRRAKEIAGNYGLNDRFQLITNDFEGRHQKLLSKDEFNAAVDELKITALSKRYEQIINRQKVLLAQKPAAGKMLYMISDFQQQNGPKMPGLKNAGNINLVKINANPQANITIDSVALLSPFHQPGATEKLLVRFVNYGEENAENISYKLSINNIQKAIGTVNIAPKSQVLDTLDFSGLAAGWQQATLNVKDFPVVFDDQFYFSFLVKPAVNVLNIGVSQPNKFIKAVYETDAYFKLNQSAESNINYNNFSQQQLIILSDLKTIADGLSQQVKLFVEKGGNLAVFLPLDADLNSYKSFFQSLQTDYPTNLIKLNLNVVSIKSNDKLFEEVFENVPKNPDLPKSNQYYEITALSKTNKKVLLGMQNNKAFLSAYQLKKGSIYLFSTPLGEDFGNLQQHALFVPIMFNMALLGGNQLLPLAYNLGDDNVVRINNTGIAERQSLKLKLKNTEIIPDLRQTDAGTNLFLDDQIKEAGIYQLNLDRQKLADIAFNQNRQESNLSYMDDEKLGQIFGNQNKIIDTNTGNALININNKGISSSLWKVCLILVLCFLGAEILLISYFKTSGKETVIHE